MQILWALGLAATLAGAEKEGATKADAYPLSPEMTLIERDIRSPEYVKILEDMIPTELAAEWQRAVNPDDATSFAMQHGGLKKVQADPALRAAYDQRQQIVTAFLDIVRNEYRRRMMVAPFDKGADAMKVPTAAGKASGAAKIEVVHATPEAAGQWYRWRGANGQGIAHSDKPPLHWSADKNVVWKAKLPGVGNSSPVLWGEHIYLTSSTAEGETRSVLCLDLAGKLVWQQDFTVPKMERKVRDKNGFASATVCTDGDAVFAFLGNIGIVCIGCDGALRWKQEVGSFDGTWGPAASPMLYKESVILVQDQHPGPSIRIALDKATGKEVWRSDDDGSMGWCTPVTLRIDGRDVMIYSSNERLIACDPSTGKELWFCEGVTREPVPSIITGNGLIYCTSGRNGPTIAVQPGGSGNVTKTHLVWSVVRGGPHVPSPVLAADRIFLINDRGILSCLNALTGETVYQKRLQGKFSASPLAVGPYLYVPSEEGVTYVLRVAGDYELVSENDLGEPILASFALVNDRLYIRTPSTLYCIEEK